VNRTGDEIGISAPSQYVMVDELWCRVLVVGPDRATVARHRLGGPGTPDLGVVDDIARLALLAGRIKGKIILSDVSPAVAALLDLAGLPVEMEGQAERGEEALGFQEGQEKLQPGDLTG
jgi:hypothetical protein